MATGFILRIRGSEISRQPYAPGEIVGDIESQSLDLSMVRELVSALTDAAVWDLPRNLHYDGTAELEVAVLDSRHTASARSSFRSADADSQARFERMLEQLEGLLRGHFETRH